MSPCNGCTVRHRPAHQQVRCDQFRQRVARARPFERPRCMLYFRSTWSSCCRIRRTCSTRRGAQCSRSCGCGSCRIPRQPMQPMQRATCDATHATDDVGYIQRLRRAAHTTTHPALGRQHALVQYLIAFIRNEVWVRCIHALIDMHAC